MPSSAIILFTKAPVPGLVKTRLIDQEGISPDAKEVAELYKALLTDTLIVAKRACEATGGKLIVSFRPIEGETTLKSLIDPIVSDGIYTLQKEATVTERVRGAFEFAFSLGFAGVCLIPGDHPDLNSQTLIQALQKTSQSENPTVVLGPTFDGGGYLLGFNKPSFEKIKFSVEDTYRVCADIFLKSKSEGIPCSFLENKNDIDDWDDAWCFLRSNASPDDSKTRQVLERYDHKAVFQEDKGKQISIIIPTLNEEKNISGILDSLKVQTRKDFEVILVDGSSSDDTVQRAWGGVDKIAFVGNPSRKRQEIVGAYGAKGKVLLFLHADSLVSPTLCESILEATEADNVIGGSCHAIFQGHGARLSFLNAMRSCGNELFDLHGISAGFFVKRKVFISASGFREDVMEEAVDFQERTKKWGTFVTVDEQIISSPRRFTSRKTFVPTLSIWIMTVLLTYFGLHFTSIERKLWNSVR